MKGLLGDRSVTIGLGMTTKARGRCLREGTVHTPLLDLLQQSPARFSSFIEVEIEAQTGLVLGLRLAWSQSKIQDEHWLALPLGAGRPGCLKGMRGLPGIPKAPRAPEP